MSDGQLRSNVNVKFRVGIRRASLAVLACGLAVGLGASSVSAQAAPKVANGNIYFKTNLGDARYVAANGSGGGVTTVTGLKSPKSSLSPNGSKLAYVDNGTVMVSNSNGSGASVVRAGDSFPDQTARADMHLSWSPDGSKLAYVVSDGLAVVGADGSGYHRVPNVTSSTGLFHDVDWASNNEVLYLPWNNLGQEKVCRLNQLTGANASCTTLPEYRGVGPVAYNYQSFSVSPDRTKLALIVYRDSYGPRNESASVMVSNLNGSNMKYVYKSKVGYQAGVFDYTAARDVVWSPDSKKVVYNVTRYGDTYPTYGVFTANSDGTGTNRVVDVFSTLNAWARR